MHSIPWKFAFKLGGEKRLPMVALYSHIQVFVVKKNLHCTMMHHWSLCLHVRNDLDHRKVTVRDI